MTTGHDLPPLGRIRTGPPLVLALSATGEGYLSISVHRIDPAKEHLAAEFMANPLGHRSPELQRVLWIMRGGEVKGKYALVCTKPYREWTLARLGAKGRPLKLVTGRVYTSIEDAERDVFRLRWNQYTGHDLDGAPTRRLGKTSTMANGGMKILGYSDEISVAPGQAIKFMVSCDGVAAYQADVVRVICGDANPAGPGFKEEVVRTPVSRRYKGRRQLSYLGSYAVIPSRAAVDNLESFTIQVMIWPTTPTKGEQTLIAKWTDRSKSGFQLMIDDGGALALRLGDGKGRSETVSCRKPLLEREWHFVGASYNAKSRRVSVYQEPFVRYARGDSHARATKASRLTKVAKGTGAITMAATIKRTVKGRNITAAHYNGKLDSPRLIARALSRLQMSQIYRAPPPSHLRTATLGAWDFSLDTASQRITDISGNGLHGETVNLPTRAKTGHNWTGAETRFSSAPDQYGAIHFHNDDLYDCGWEPDFELTVPKTMKSGAYAVRLRSGKAEDYIPFFVRPGRDAPRAKILYLAQTATYMAYANATSFLDSAEEVSADRLTVAEPWMQHLNLHPELGASLYDLHSDGSGICYSSRLRPILNMRPKVMDSSTAGGSSLWGYNADTHLTDWLKAKGHDFDVATDEDLDKEGMDLLRPYRVVLTGTHPEYTSSFMWDALKAYTEGGGRLMYMGGNGFYWRIAFHPTLPGVMEVRRAENGSRAWHPAAGESYHSFNGEYGGLWRAQDKAPQRISGAGFISQGFDICTYFKRTADSANPRIKWAFKGIGRNEKIGDFGLIGGGAAGLEVDIADRRLGTPRHALVVACTERLPDSYLLVLEEQFFPMPTNVGTANPLIRAELVFHETPNGGAVFAFSSIAWCGSLSHNNYDNNVSRLTNNVLERFVANATFV